MHTGTFDNTSLGDGTRIGRAQPRVVPGLPPITAIDSGDYDSWAVARDGRVWAWGGNIYGQVADGTREIRDRPFQVPGLTDVVKVVGGAYNAFALRVDGTAYGWGSNFYGQLGDGTTIFRLHPVRVHLGHLAQLAIADRHVIALRTDGTVCTWGFNISGQLGRPWAPDDNNPHPTPQPVPGLHNIRHVAAGGESSYALR